MNKKKTLFKVIWNIFNPPAKYDPETSSADPRGTKTVMIEVSNRVSSSIKIQELAIHQTRSGNLLEHEDSCRLEP